MENGDVSPTLFFLLKICGYFEIELAELIAQASSKTKRGKKSTR